MSIDPAKFYNILISNGIDFFTGVPDSLLKELCFYINDFSSEGQHVIAANEGNAIAIAAGYHLGTGKIPLVYMQNSGLGNAINPLISLCDPNLYSIPMLLLIGWRGEPGIRDEPQHIKQGKIQLDFFKVMDIPFEIISKDDQEVYKKIDKGVVKAVRENRPFAILVKRGTFDKYINPPHTIDDRLMTREQSLEILLEQLPNDSIIVSTTGKTSREIFEIRKNNGEPHFKDFLTVGSMGHCSSIALGISIVKPDQKVICIDGDGSLIMHMGSLSTIGKINPKNFYHILINNFVHDSVGGQATSAHFIEMLELAKANGYRNLIRIEDSRQMNKQINNFLKRKGPGFLEVRVRPGSRDNLGRPDILPVDNKKSFMECLSK